MLSLVLRSRSKQREGVTASGQGLEIRFSSLGQSTPVSALRGELDACGRGFGRDTEDAAAQ